jgi:hypothetical protein
VRLEGLEGLDPGVAADLLAFFLHDPAALGAVHPFAALLAALVEKQEVSLWDLQLSGPGAEGIRDAFLRALHREQPPCMVCACFPVCQGYGVYAGGCATWLLLLPTLAGAARELARLRTQLADPNHTRGSHALPGPS